MKFSIKVKVCSDLGEQECDSPGYGGHIPSHICGRLHLDENQIQLLQMRKKFQKRVGKQAHIHTLWLKSHIFLAQSKPTYTHIYFLKNVAWKRHKVKSKSFLIVQNSLH